MCIDLAYLVGVRGRRPEGTRPPPNPHLWGGLEGAPRGYPGPSRPPQKEYSVSMYGSVAVLPWWESTTTRHSRLAIALQPIFSQPIPSVRLGAPARPSRQLQSQ